MRTLRAAVLALLDVALILLLAPAELIIYVYKWVEHGHR